MRFDKVAPVIFSSAILAIAAISFAAAEQCKYESHGRRDPFVPLVGSEKASAGRLEEITSADDLKLEGIATDATGGKTAILNGEIVKVGQKRGLIEIKKITDNTVEILMNGKKYSIKLYEEGGQKSEQ